MSRAAIKSQTFDELASRYQKLNQRKIENETNLRNAQKQLDDLYREAESEFGTSDLDELRRLLATWEQENEQKRADYQQLLDEVEAQLEQVDQTYSQFNPV